MRRSFVVASVLVPFIVMAAGCGGSSPTGTEPPPAPPPPPGQPLPLLGTLGVEVQGLHSPYPNTAGTVSILRTDVPNQTPLTVIINLYPTEGYYTTQHLSPGSYQITFTPIAPYHISQGQTTTLNAEVNAMGTTWISFSVTDVETSGSGASLAPIGTGGESR